MYLAGLDIAGFKSFAKKARLKFEPGITAIVGPNGSGKSATADAIRWVLGEQSLKSIRAKRGEDVIFAGSRSRARLGLAEVSLMLADTEGTGLDTAELVITRRIDRSGQSDYLINGRPVRLFDLAEILATAGLAQKSYTVIPQGMIDSFVTASPQERRQMFEDATGVTPLILKQQHTERKLEATRQHVLRARDLLRELEPRLRTLKRQAARARSRAEVETSLRTLEAQHAAHHWQARDAALRTVRARLQELDARIHQATREIVTLRKSVAAGAEDAARLPELRRAIEQLRTEERDLLLALTRTEVAGADTTDRVAEELTARTKEREKLTHELGDVQAKLTTAQQERARIARELASLHDALRSFGPGGEQPALPTSLTGKLRDLQRRVQTLASHLRTASGTPDVAALTTNIEDIAHALEALAGEVEISLQSAPNADPFRATLERLRTLLQGETRAEEDATTLRVREAGLRERIRAVEERLGDLRVRGHGPAGPALDVSEARTRLVEVQRTLAARSSDAANLEGALVRATQEQEHRDGTERQMRETLHAVEQERARLAAEEAALRAHHDDLQRDVTERLGGAFLARLQRGEVAPASVPNPEALRADIDRLRKRLLEIGGIDTTVLDEEATVEKRVNELRAQVEDLDTARKNLRAAIRELEQHIHQRFTEAFRSMNEAFNRSFREIFGGGRASLSLVKPKPIEHAFPDLPSDETEDQPREAPEGATWGRGDDSTHVHDLPAGVEIHVHPPGKKLQNLAQLSGGEKALTSIALLFAILSERASPFVVLDEVDAALDESNSRRFARLLKEVSARTQCVVITHNRATMEAARALYGVTMGEDGVSQLLSIKLEDVPENAERGHTLPADS